MIRSEYDPSTHELVARKPPEVSDNFGKYLMIFLAGMTLAWWLWYTPAKPWTAQANTAPNANPPITATDSIPNPDAGKSPSDTNTLLGKLPPRLPRGVAPALPGRMKDWEPDPDGEVLPKE